MIHYLRESEPLNSSERSSLEITKENGTEKNINFNYSESCICSLHSTCNYDRNERCIIKCTNLHHHNVHSHTTRHGTPPGIKVIAYDEASRNSLTTAKLTPLRIITKTTKSNTAKTLTIVMGGFISCWTPFFIYYILIPFLPSNWVIEDLQKLFTWIGWINSAINPFIYAFYNPNFRLAFWRITFGMVLKNRNRSLRVVAWTILQNHCFYLPFFHYVYWFTTNTFHGSIVI